MPQDSRLISFEDEQGVLFRGALIHHSKNQIEFELYNPRAQLKPDSTLHKVRIERQQQCLFEGQATIQHLHVQPYLRLVQAKLIAVEDQKHNTYKPHSPELRLLSHVAHELRTPLLSIHAAGKGLARYLPQLIENYRAQRQSPATTHISDAHLDALRQVPHSIEQHVNDLNHMVDSLLQDAQHKRNQSQGFRAFSARECVENALQAHPRWSALKAHTHLQVDEDFMIHGSPQLMRHVIFNLLSNADAAIRQGLSSKGKGEISILLECGQHFNCLHFKDTGCGIEADVLPHIFDDYFSTRQPGQGTGLGLAFCRDTLLCHGGDIDCRSVAGEFSHFILRLPVIKPMQTQVSAMPDSVH